jgi:hypothetical protein
MIPALSSSRSTTPVDPAVPDRAAFHVADALLPLSLGLWACGISRTDTAELGPYGLPAVLPVVFYAGLALLVVSAAVELARPRPSRWRMSLHAAALVIVLYGTAPLVYSYGRYAWLYKTIGVVQYVNGHGHLSSHIDIYQNWPGFFALAAWFGKVAGVATPLGYAKWAQLVVELAALPLLYLAYDALSLTVRQRWVALLLYAGSNWIGQDYFSPQGLGTLLSLGVMAVAMRWLYVGNDGHFVGRSRRSGRHRPGGPMLGAIGQRMEEAGQRPPGDAPDTAEADEPPPWRPPPPAARPILFCAVLVFLYFVLTFTHELSPYLVAIQLGALAAARRLRPRGLPIALFAIAIGYLLPRLAFVNSHYGLLDSFGNFFSNAAPPTSEGSTPLAGSEIMIQHAETLLSLVIWILALAGAWLRRRSGRTVLALMVLTFSPACILLAQAYGNEGVLRVYLFSLPWAAALAASALEPVAAFASRSRTHLPDIAGSIAFERRMPTLRVLCVPLVLGVVLALFFPAFFGDDSFNVMSKTEVDTITSFLQTARIGPVYSAVDNAPLQDTAKYNLFPLPAIFGTLGGPPVTTRATPDIATVIAQISRAYTHGREPAYVLVSPSMIAHSHAYGEAPPDSFTILLNSLAHSRDWKLVVDRDGTIIYELPPAVTDDGAGAS